MRAGLIPVVQDRHSSRHNQKAQFDPAVVVRLRKKVATWRKAERNQLGSGEGRQPSCGTSNDPAVPPNRESNTVARVAGLDHYAAHFATARALDRRIIAYLGPTNSGKTYLGLTQLAEAESGLALGPLRLLAHEYREALEARGIPTSLSTGEERIIVPGSRHTSATVEMCPFHNLVDVAVIDEAQMLDDPERGAGLDCCPDGCTGSAGDCAWCAGCGTADPPHCGAMW